MATAWTFRRQVRQAVRDLAVEHRGLLMLVAPGPEVPYSSVGSFLAGSERSSWLVEPTWKASGL